MIIGDYAYVAGTYMNSDIADITDPTALAFATAWTGPVVSADSFWLQGTTLFMCDGSDLHTYSMTTPGSFGSVLDTYSPVGFQAKFVTVDGDYAYVVGGSNDTVHVLDVSNPSSIQFVSDFTDINMDFGLNGANPVCFGDYLYVPCPGSNGVMCINKSDPSNLAVHQWLPDPGDGSNDYSLTSPYRILRVGQYLYVTGYRLTVIDTGCSSPAHLTVIGYIEDGDVSIVWPEESVVSGNYLYFVDNLADAFHVVDVSTPTSPSVVGTIDTAGSGGALNSVQYVTYLAGHCYTIAFTSGVWTFRSIDVSTPATPSLVGSTTHAQIDTALPMSGSGSHIFASRSAADTLVVIDVSTPASPSVVATLVDGTDLNGVARSAVSGSHLFAVCPAGDTFTSVDISTPTAPTVADSITDGTVLQGPVDVAISGSYAYVADFTSGSLVVVDITTPTAMTIAGSVTDADLASAQHVVVAGNYAFVVAGSAPYRLTAVDVSNPASPTVVATLEEDGFLIDVMVDVSVVAGYAYVSSRGTPGSVAVIALTGV